MSIPVMALCDRCQRNMQEFYYLEKVDEPRELRTCTICCREEIMARYGYEQKKARRERMQRAQSRSGPRERDRRARYREPFRGDKD